MSGWNARVQHVGTCGCGKRSYASKADAKRALQFLYPGEKNLMNVYRHDEVWHIGHLDPAVKAGRTDRGGRYRGDAK